MMQDVDIQQVTQSRLKGTVLTLPAGQEFAGPDLFHHQLMALEQFVSNDQISGIFHIPTGGGKTNIAFGLIARALKENPRHRFIWATHHLQLVRQAMARCANLGGQFPEGTKIAWFSDKKLDRIKAFEQAHILFMTRGQLKKVLQNASEPKQTRYFLRKALAGCKNHEPHPVTLIYDESHELGAKGLQRIWRKFEDRLLKQNEGASRRWTTIGLSATPMPTEAKRQQLLKESIFPPTLKSLGERPDWQVMVHASVSVDALREQQVLCPVDMSVQDAKTFEIPTDIMMDATEGVAFELPEEPKKSDVERFSRQFNAQVMAHPAVLKFLAERLAENLKSKLGKTLVFCANIHAAEQLARMLRQDPRVGEGRVSLVHSALQDYEDDVNVDSEGAEIDCRNLFGEAFEAQRQVAAFIDKGHEPCIMINVGMLTTGFDDPKIQTVLFARLTLSTNLLFQMLGRGLRGPKVGGTASCTLIDPIRLLSRFNVAQGYRPHIGRFKVGEREIIKISPGLCATKGGESLTLEIAPLTTLSYSDRALRRDLAHILIEFLDLGHMPEPSQVIESTRGLSPQELYSGYEQLVVEAERAAYITHQRRVDLRWLLQSRHLPRSCSETSLTFFATKVKVASEQGISSEPDWEAFQLSRLTATP